MEKVITIAMNANLKSLASTHDCPNNDNSLASNSLCIPPPGHVVQKRVVMGNLSRIHVINFSKQ